MIIEELPPFRHASHVAIAVLVRQQRISSSRVKASKKGRKESVTEATTTVCENGDVLDATKAL